MILDLLIKLAFNTPKSTRGLEHKAQLIVKGYMQKQGIDYEEAFTPIARI
jgi:hypothetical protein